jgi:GMP synthase (glutamine-hydrolysing)
MSHQDMVTVTPPGFVVIGRTKDCPRAAMQCLDRRRFALQFHVEVKDTLDGGRILENFARFCGMERNWDQDAVLDRIMEGIREGAGGKRVLLFLSGGVDSTVAFALLNRALGQERVLGLHIDNGFMRQDESAVIAGRYREWGFTNFIVEDASSTFLAAIEGLVDPQDKRRTVGETFIAVRDKVAAKLDLDPGAWLLAQGTLYPDIIESGGTEHARTIKTHHNRVAGIQALLERGLVIEPLRDLYKDEVRLLGKKLRLPDELIWRHPFPGPGLSINVLGSNGTVASDYDAARLAVTPFSPVIDVLPVRSVGVQGDYRTYRYPAVLDAALPLDWDALEALSAGITNTVPEVNRVIVELYRRPGSAFALQAATVTRERLDQTRAADAIVLAELKRTGWYGRIFQHLTVNVPWASTGKRCSIVLRPVSSEDVMTARFARLPPDVLAPITHRIIALPFVDALYYDVTNKPPATFGWE